MFVVTAISLITVKLALKILGIEDYGIYNVVGGLVAFISFVTGSLQTATMRFYAYAIGKQDSEEQNTIFNTSLWIYSTVVIFIIIIAETVGLWFLNNKMNIPADRQDVTFWIYQFSLVSFSISVWSIPFSSMIIAHENMKLFAILNMVGATLKLLMLIPLSQMPYDKLFMYGFMLLAITLLIESIGIFYCRKNYKECHFNLAWNPKIFRSIFSYSGWNLFGALAGMTYNQGNNLITNVFFGPLENAARAIAFQVSNAMNLLSDNFFVVIRPPLIKSYAEQNDDYTLRLFYLSSKFSYFLLFVVFLPLLVETEYLLNLWLDEVSDHMLVFTQLNLISALILSMNAPISTMIHAIGTRALKRYNLIVETVILLSLPLTYLAFKLGYAVESAFYVSIFISIIAHICRIIVLKSVMNFSLREYVKKNIFPILVITILSCALVFYIHSLFEYGLIRFIVTVPLAVATVVLFSFTFGVNRQEKQQLFYLIKKKKHE
ncbi:hypothetical protein FACS189413_12150 [Bacteroidia bacterium]|nr:hypothetical protein FACS189413_12150 [Bacteroidia bacterium]